MSEGQAEELQSMICPHLIASRIDQALGVVFPDSMGFQIFLSLTAKSLDTFDSVAKRQLRIADELLNGTVICEICPLPALDEVS